MKTIIQTIGPLYGQVVDGSVFGQPNGSIAVTPGGPVDTNVLTIRQNPGYIKGVPTGTGRYHITFADSTGAAKPFIVVGSSNVDFRLSFTILIGSVGSGYSARINASPVSLDRFPVSIENAPEVGTTYTVKVDLVNINGDVLKTENVAVVGGVRMSANEHYVPAFHGGTIRGVQIELVNNTSADISAAARNGVYYVYQGSKFQLLGCDGVIIPANGQKIVTVELREQTVPGKDIKLMVDTTGLIGITATVQILWSVSD